MELFSNYYSDNIPRDHLDTILKNAGQIIILSGYYDCNFILLSLKKVSSRFRNNCPLSFVFNGYSGLRLNNQIKELKHLRSRMMVS